MILAQLLAAGRSLILGEDRENRYKLPRHQWLPTFGAGRNPFNPEAKAKPRPTPTLPIQAAAMPAAMPETVPVSRPTPVPKSYPEPVPAPPVAPGCRPGWLSRLNPFALSSGGVPALRGKTGRRNGGERQVELSLATVTVVRNDLSDGDEETLAPLSGHRHNARPSAPERDVEEATVNRLNQSFRSAEQVSLF
jgi:hypothetical protein